MVAAAREREAESLQGRDCKLAELRAVFASSRAGRPTRLRVSGDSGVGKTALCRAFLAELLAQGAVVLSGRCHERESVPFKGIDSLVDDLSRVLRKLDSAGAAALLPREVYALARIFPVLNRVEVIAHAPTKDIVEPQELRRRAFHAFYELLARICDRAPLVLYIDDAQSRDRDARTFLGHVLSQQEALPVLLVLSHRDTAPELPL